MEFKKEKRQFQKKQYQSNKPTSKSRTFEARALQSDIVCLMWKEKVGGSYRVIEKFDRPFSFVANTPVINTVNKVRKEQFGDIPFVTKKINPSSHQEVVLFKITCDGRVRRKMVLRGGEAIAFLKESGKFSDNYKEYQHNKKTA